MCVQFELTRENTSINLTEKHLVISINGTVMIILSLPKKTKVNFVQTTKKKTSHTVLQYLPAAMSETKISSKTVNVILLIS